MKNKFNHGSAALGLLIVIVVGVVIFFVFAKTDPSPEFEETEEKTELLEEEIQTSLDE